MKQDLIDIERIKEFGKKLENHKNQIMNYYQNLMGKLLIETNQSLMLDNNKYEEIEKNLKKNIEKWDDNIESLLYILSNQIIPIYQDSTYEINNLFDNNFAQIMNEILEIQGKKNE